jgi:hypothetical protein
MSEINHQHIVVGSEVHHSQPCNKDTDQHSFWKIQVSSSNCQFVHTKLLELTWFHTRPSLICIHGFLLGVPQNLEVSLCILLPQLLH